MADFDNNSRMAISQERKRKLKERMDSLSGDEKKLAEEIVLINGPHYTSDKTPVMDKVIREYYLNPDKTPSQLFAKKGGLFAKKYFGGLLDVFVPKKYQASYLYIIDKLNRFPYSAGWNRRPVRTLRYGPHMQLVFRLLLTYERLFYCGQDLRAFILRQLEPEILDYIKSGDAYFMHHFNLLYAAEIDRGNGDVIEALQEVILSESNTSWLDRSMIQGILCSDSEKLHRLVSDLLVAARLQEGLRQAICESMDEGTEQAFLLLLKTIEEKDLLRYASVKRAVSTWIGIFSETSTDRISGKLLNLMGRCLREPDFCREQLKTNDSVAVSAGLWARGFREAEDAIQSMKELIDHGTRNQMLTASYYNQMLYDDSYKSVVAKKAILEHPDDMELLACFMPAFTCRLDRGLNRMFENTTGGSFYYGNELRKPVKPELTDMFTDRAEAEKLYHIFMDAYGKMPKKGLVYDPCIFPWYKVELSPASLLCELSLIAYVLQDEEKITRMAGLLGEMSTGSGRSYKSLFLNLLLYHPENQEQRNALIGYVGNAEESTSCMAFAIVKKLDLKDGEYLLLEDMLRFKRSSLRKNLIDLLMEQGDEQLESTLKRLLADKREEKRTAALDMLMQLGRSKDRKNLYGKVEGLPLTIEEPTDKEKILIEELAGRTESMPAAGAENGYGFYDRSALPSWQEVRPDREVLRTCLPLPERDVISVIKKLDALVEQYKDYEYTACDGEKTLLGNRYRRLEDAESSTYHLENYPLARELREFYETEIVRYEILMEMEALLFTRNAYQAGAWAYQAVFGKLPFKPEPIGLKYPDQVRQIHLNYRNDYLDKAALFKESLAVITSLTEVMDQKKKRIVFQYSGWNGNQFNTACYVSQLPLFDRYFEGLGYWRTDDEFRRAFQAAYNLETKCRETSGTGQFLTDRRESMTPIRMYWFMKAYDMDMIPMDIVLRFLLEYSDTIRNLQVLTQFMKGECSRTRNRWSAIRFFGEEYFGELQEKGDAYMLENTAEGRICREIYDRLVPAMVDTELRRGDSETAYSQFMSGITYIPGVRYLVRILMAMGKDTLDRNSYYGWHYGGRIYSKKEVLSGLLKACYPAPGETSRTLGDMLAGTKIKESRLVEVAMYAPQWIDIIEGYLGWRGLKSGCYYFMAHMDENFDDRKKAMIAKYTPLSPEELQNGAFDINWFKEAYGQLGEEHFSLLYNGAKYISDGLKHSRARKYADAATGRVDTRKLKEEISAKRNKDLLMSLGLVPFGGDKNMDMVDRYQYIQQFLKESSQFGAQRRANEARAVETALTNLSVNAGFADVTRLTLNMETRLMEQSAGYMEWHTVEDTQVKLAIGKDGKSNILCRKTDTGKALKSIPSRLGKETYVAELKAVHKKLKDQYSRTRKMMEESMESQTVFTVEEIAMLYGNPVAKAILKPLVFAAGDGMGFLEDGKDGLSDTSLALVSHDGSSHTLKGSDCVKIAHPLDLYKSGKWHEYQKYIFNQRMKQPFKQVFRELYVKMPEEKGQKYSRMFAGNQIQPQKTVAVLRGRRWVADYEEGLQKVYYKEDIIARIYALADWFSPSDAEAPALEWVEFSNRKSFEPITIDQVPDVIYSEVMRDVDLAVSVAHAGGVDPETSHSTIGMRRAIVEFNLPLFGISNVTLKDSHAMIKGTRGEYSVHLGSGVVHQAGGSMLHILPVHSQSRGKLFLPFVDEDPKTAEIMSKIVLLAEDKKLKDPSILAQIV